MHHADSIDVFKILYPNQRTYALGKLYRSIMGVDFESAHDASSDVGAMLTLMTHKADAALVFDTIVAKRESINTIIKRCFKN